jgi:hypothetical protein
VRKTWALHHETASPTAAPVNAVREKDPQRRGLLYAGTEPRGVRSSLRRRRTTGRSCRPCTCARRHSTPTWSVISVRTNLVCGASHGRSFWILGRRPRRCASSTRRPAQSVRRPVSKHARRAFRVRFWGTLNNTPTTRVPPEEPQRARTRRTAAVVNYDLKSAASRGSSRLEVPRRREQGHYAATGARGRTSTKSRATKAGSRSELRIRTAERLATAAACTASTWDMRPGPGAEAGETAFTTNRRRFPRQTP